MAESDYFWTTKTQQELYTNYIDGVLTDTTGNPGDPGTLIEISAFTNSRELWSKQSRGEAVTALTELLTIRNFDAQSGGGYYTAPPDTFSAPIFLETRDLTAGTPSYGGSTVITGYTFSVEVYYVSYRIYTLNFFGAPITSTRYSIILGIPKSYDPNQVTVPDSSGSYPIALQPINYEAFNSSTDGYGLTVNTYPKPTTGDTTLQLGRAGDVTGTYYAQPGYESVLAKYSSPVTVIRAKFDTTRTAVIEDTVDGGFMIYEEVASAAVSPVYVYNGQRRLVQIIDAAYIAQYRAS